MHHTREHATCQHENLVHKSFSRCIHLKIWMKKYTSGILPYLYVSNAIHYIFLHCIEN